MDPFGTIEVIIIFSLIIVLPLIYIRVMRGKDSSLQYKERPSLSWKDTVEYRLGEEYLKVMRHDKEPEEDEKKNGQEKNRYYV